MSSDDFNLSDVTDAVKRLKKSSPSRGQHSFIPPNIVLWNVAIKMTAESLHKLPELLREQLIIVVPDEDTVRDHVSPLINTSSAYPYFAEYERFRFMVAQSVDVLK